MTKHRTFSVVVETENLGLAGLEDLEASLTTLKSQTVSIEKANEVLIIAGGHLSKEAQHRLKERFPWVTLHPVDEDLSYTEAKVLGAQLATGEIVVFADSDVRYEATWLENLLSLFATHPDATVAVGDTRLNTRSIYTMALSLTWMIQIYPKTRDPKPIKRFQFNNFAIKRDVMLAVPFPRDYPLYRGNAMVWRSRLLLEGHKFYRVPGALGVHAPPGNLADLFYRMLVQGSDVVAKADFTFDKTGEKVEKRSILKRLFFFLRLCLGRGHQYVSHAYILITEDFRAIGNIFLSLPIVLFTNFLIILGGLIAIFNRDFVFHKITEREGKHTV